MTYRALLMGNSVFDADASLNPLNAPTKDVARLHRALVDPATGLFADDNVRLVIERTANDLLDELDAFFSSAHRDDLLLLYYSGHGLLDERNQLFLCGRDTRSDRLLRTAVSNVRINEFIDQSVARCSVIILDCCSSGMFKGGDIGVPLAGPGRYVVSSTRGSALANDAATATGTSLFTEHLVAGLLGEAEDRDGDGYVDLREIYDYVRKKLTATTKQVPHSRFDGDAAIVLAKRAAPYLSAMPGPARHARHGDPTFVLSENTITLHDVDPDEHLGPETIEIYRLGDAEVDCTAETDAGWLHTDVHHDRVVVVLNPREGHNRGKIMIRDRLSGTAQVVRVYVYVNRRRPDAPPVPQPPGDGDRTPPVADGTPISAVTAPRQPAPIPAPAKGDREGDHEGLPESRRRRSGVVRRVLLRPRLVAILVALLVLGTAGVAAAMNRGGDPPGPPMPAVPSLVGLAQARAEEALRARRLTPKVAAASPGQSCAPGQVTAQSPPAGQAVREGTQVGITICGAPPHVTTPDVIGKTEPEATKAITGAKLKPVAGPPHQGGDCKAGRVATQTPAARSPLDEGATVTYSLCTGPKTVIVPPLGYSQHSAEAALDRAGLRARFVRSDSAKPEGQVLRSDPARGSKATIGTTIVVYLSRGNLCEVPDVTGESEDAVPDAFAGACVLYDILYVRSEQHAGMVVDQDPSGGEEVERGSTVTVKVSSGPGPTMTSPPPGGSG
jgi:beta-lactam-binding protein with PASTA domain